jgi:hypothetical protein
VSNIDKQTFADIPTTAATDPRKTFDGSATELIAGDSFPPMWIVGPWCLASRTRT